MLVTDLVIKRNAELSVCGKYRYRLSRIWDDKKPLVLFIMLNPSTADAEQDDPTIRRCIAFAKNWGYGGFMTGNLFAFRSASPEKLYRKKDPAGELNDRSLLEMAAQCERVVFAWGEHGSLHQAHQRVRALFPDAWCLGKNKSGQPKHPLYIRADAELIQF